MQSLTVPVPDRMIGDSMLDRVVELTNAYIAFMPKQERKKYGQFFTSKETARFMASLFHIPKNQKKVTILDAGAGSGILCCALVERLERCKGVEEVSITCYENDANIMQQLADNMKYVQDMARIRVQYQIVAENYITSQELDFNSLAGSNAALPKFDLVIGNPPYMKMARKAPEAVAMSHICHGTPNLYFLFAAMSLFNLRNNGEMVYIIPRSWTSGAYFKKFRQYLLKAGKLSHIHLFVSRNKVFDKEKVLQETMIIKLKKSPRKPSRVKITSSNTNHDFRKLTTLSVPYNIVVAGEEEYVYLVTNQAEVHVLERLNKWNYTLPDIGMKMRTGLTVDFRNREALRSKEEEGAVPLFYAQHIKGGQVCFPIAREYEYILTNRKGLLQENKNYLFVKRFSAKEEPRRLQCGIYLSGNYPRYNRISTQNKVNFIDGLTTDLSECVVYGLYVLFNSSLYDNYYKILNGSTQVNATEINTMPVPDLETIREMGERLMKSKDLSVKNCNHILGGYDG